MKVRYDDGEIELTDRVIRSLKEHMRATVAMMREADAENADCWTWGRCEVVDFSAAGGVEFYYGGYRRRLVVAMKASA